MENHLSTILCGILILLTEVLCCQVKAKNPDYADLLHPRYYTNVFELEYGIGNDKYNIIYEGKDSNIVEVINAEVDYRSKILIQFNKDVIEKLSQKYDGEITITGQIGSRPLEIPGYSVIGEQKRTVSAFFRSGSKVKSSIEQVLAVYDYLEDQFEFIIDDHPLPEQDEIIKFWKYIKSDDFTESIENNINYLNLQIDTLIGERLELLMIKDSADSIRIDEIDRKIDSISTVIYAKYAPEINEVANYISIMDNLRKNLLLYYPTMKFDLKNISDSSNKNILEQICRLAEPEQHPANIIEKTHALVDYLFPELNKYSLEHSELKNESQEVVINKINTLYKIFFSIYENLYRFDSFSELNYDELNERLMSELKSTEILLQKENARVGDNILIFIETKTNKYDIPRTLTISLLVKEFGLVNKISDSFFLIKPLYPTDSSELDSSDVNQSFIDTKQFTPSAGVTYFWTLYSRDSDNGWSDIVRFLKPGFGLNVSFPTYQPKIVRYDTTVVNGSRQLVIEETENSFNVAFGLVASIFDNALQFTFGWNLTSGTGKERYYFGLGFSFINLGRRITGASD